MLNERAVPFLDPSVDLSMTGLREWKIRKEKDLFISNWLLFILQGRSTHQEIAKAKNSCWSLVRSCRAMLLVLTWFDPIKSSCSCIKNVHQELMLMFCWSYQQVADNWSQLWPAQHVNTRVKRTGASKVLLEQQCKLKFWIFFFFPLAQLNCI